MRKKLIILVNCETLCAYRVTTDDLSTPKNRIEKIDIQLPSLHPDPLEATDNEGRFPAGSAVQSRTTMRHGEPHKRITEKRKRLLRNIAHAICDIINQNGYLVWNLAIPADLYHQLIEELPMHVQQKLTRLKKGDYTHFPIKKIEHLFDS